jgi:signal transduction histidine kinase
VNPSELRAVGLLAELSDARLAELARAGREVRYRAGEYVFREGDAATHFMFLLEGELETTRNMGGDEVAMQRHVPGGYLGAIALLTDTPFRGSTRAVMPSRVFHLEQDAFHRLVLEHPAIRRTVFQVFAPVLQGFQAVAATREKLVALGSLAAGLAHELNNPAAAVRRAAAELAETERERGGALVELLASGAPAETVVALVRAATKLDGDPACSVPLDALERSDVENRMAARLSAAGVADAAWHASTLADAGIDERALDRVLAAAGEAPVDLAVRWLAARLAAPRLLAEIAEAAARIGDLVGAVKQYSFMDQAPRQEVDVNAGLESTLTILAHKLGAGGVRVERALDPELPRIDAYGSELNQLWTNLLDNAIDAVGTEGTIRIRTGLDVDRVVVEVTDDGPGIPADVQARIFEPFFTTKPVGKGTGLGLDIAQRIVIRHRGELTVASRPGETTFRVRLPLAQPQ